MSNFNNQFQPAFPVNNAVNMAVPSPQTPQTTNNTAIFNGLSDLIRTHVLTPLSAHLSTRGVSISVEEMAHVTMLAAAAPATPSLMPNTGIGGLFGKSMLPGSEKATSTAPTGGCVHPNKTGLRKGLPCGKTLTQGSEYCSTHKKAHEATSATAAINGMGGMASFAALGLMQTPPNPTMLGGGFPGFGNNGATTIPTVAHMPSSHLGPMTLNQPPALPVTSQFGLQMATQPVKPQTINITAIPSMPGCSLIEGPHRLIVRAGSAQNEYICVGYLGQNNECVTNLSSEQIAYAKSLNLALVDTQKTAIPTIPGALTQPAFGMSNMTGTMFGQNAATNSTAPALPGFTPLSAPVLPSLGAPTISSSAFPTLSAAPQNLPSIPTLSAPQMPQIPTLSTMSAPQMPQIPTASPIAAPTTAPITDAAPSLPTIPTLAPLAPIATQATQPAATQESQPLPQVANQ